MSARSVKNSKVGTSYIEKYLKTQIHNGRVQVANSTSDALYFLQGGDILDNVNVNLPNLSGDDTLAFQNFNNEFGGVQTFNKGMVSQGGLNLLPDPNGVLEDDLVIADGLNIVAGTATGTQIASDPSQLIAFYGTTPTSQPGVTIPSTAASMVQDTWNALVNLGLMSNQAGSGAAPLTFGGNAPVPSQLGYRWGAFQPHCGGVTNGDGLLALWNLAIGTDSASNVNNRYSERLTVGSSPSPTIVQFNTVRGCAYFNQQPTITFKVSMGTNSSTMALGLTNATQVTAVTLTNWLNSLSGMAIGFDSGNSNYSVAYNNGNASTTTVSTGVSLQSAGSSAILSLGWTGSAINWSIQKTTGSPTTGTISTGNLPANSTPVLMSVYISGTGATIDIESIDIVTANDFNVLP